MYKFNKNERLNKLFLHCLKENRLERLIPNGYFDFERFNYVMIQNNKEWIANVANSYNWSSTSNYNICSLINCQWTFILGFLNIVNFDENKFVGCIANRSYVSLNPTKEVELYIKIFEKIQDSFRIKIKKL